MLDAPLLFGDVGAGDETSGEAGAGAGSAHRCRGEARARRPVRGHAHARPRDGPRLLPDRRRRLLRRPVLGQGSSFVPPDGGSLSAYMDSLERLRELRTRSSSAPATGHTSPSRGQRSTSTVEHRLMRERQARGRARGGERSRARLLDDGLGRRAGRAAPRGRDRDAGAPGEARGRGPAAGGAWRLELPPCSAARSAGASRSSGAAFATLATTTAAGLWWQLLRRPLPRTTGSLRLPGLEGTVEVRRDRWGVPHIRAGSRHDLWFGAGLLPRAGPPLAARPVPARRRAGGSPRSPGSRGCRRDRLMRTLGLRRAAEREAEALDAGAALASSRRSAPGVNAAAGDRPPSRSSSSSCGSSSSRATPADTLTLTKLLAFGLSTNWERELLRAEMARELGPELTARLDPGLSAGQPGRRDARRGLGGRRAGARRADRQGARADRADASRPPAPTTGPSPARGRRPAAPLIAGDPHLPPSMPGIGYQVGLHLGDRFCRGASLPGPARASCMGQNNDVAWTFTNVMADVDGPLRRADRRRHVRVRGRAAAAGDDRGGDRGQGPRRARAPRRARHAPRADRQRGARRRRRRAAGAALGGARRAGDHRGQRSACSSSAAAPSWSRRSALHAHPVSNLVWADRHGSIGYKTVGRLPIRRGGCPDLPKPGWTGEYEWDGWVPYEELPEPRDPERGFLVTANNRIAPTTIPHHITSDYLDGYRARRIERADRRAAHEHDLESFEAMQTDISRSRDSRRRAAWRACAPATSASARRSSGCAPGTGG